MKILIIDAQGGGIGKQLISAVKEMFPQTEVTAVGQSQAKRILIPVNHCGNTVVGVEDFNIRKLVSCAMEELQPLLR